MVPLPLCGPSAGGEFPCCRPYLQAAFLGSKPRSVLSEPLFLLSLVRVCGTRDEFGQVRAVYSNYGRGRIRPWKFCSSTSRTTQLLFFLASCNSAGRAAAAVLAMPRLLSRQEGEGKEGGAGAESREQEHNPGEAGC